jgi:hypothetical protein
LTEVTVGEALSARRRPIETAIDVALTETAPLQALLPAGRAQA